MHPYSFTFTVYFILYFLRTHFIYSLLSPALLLYGVYVLSFGEKQNKSAYLWIISGVCTGYLIFAHPLTSFYLKSMSSTFQTFYCIDQCFVATTQLQQFSKIISLSSDQDRILIFEGEKSIGKSITVKAYSQASKNTLYFSVKFEYPEGIFEEVLYQLGDLNFLDLNIPLLKVFGPKKKNVPHLEYYLSSFPDTLYWPKILNSMVWKKEPPKSA